MFNVEKNVLPVLQTRNPNASRCNRRHARIKTPVVDYQILLVATPGIDPAITAAMFRSENITIKFASSIDYVVRSIIDDKFNICVLFEDPQNFDVEEMTNLIGAAAPLSHPLQKILIIPSVMHALQDRKMHRFPGDFLNGETRPREIVQYIKGELALNNVLAVME